MYLRYSLNMPLNKRVSVLSGEHQPGAYKAYISNSSDVTGVEPISFTVSKEIVVSNTTPGALALPAGVTASDFVTVSE